MVWTLNIANLDNAFYGLQKGICIGRGEYCFFFSAVPIFVFYFLFLINGIFDHKYWGLDLFATSGVFEVLTLSWWMWYIFLDGGKGMKEYIDDVAIHTHAYTHNEERSRETFSWILKFCV